MFCVFDVGNILFKHKSLEEYVIRDKSRSDSQWHHCEDMTFSQILDFSVKKERRKALWPKSSSFSVLNLEWIFSKALEGIAYFLVC